MAMSLTIKKAMTFYNCWRKGNKRGYGVKYDHEEWVFYLYAGDSYTPLIYDEPHFQYVHQLQNLYFFLTNTELLWES